MAETNINQGKFEELASHIEDMREFGRSPLFIIGAGVSAGKVPLMNEIFGYFKKVDDDTINEYADRLFISSEVDMPDYDYQNVNECAYLFNLLQSPDKKELWEKFTYDFLNGDIGEGNYGKLLKQEPNSFHKYIAKQIVNENPPAVCISLNYDGLTAKAVRELALGKIERGESLYPARVLSSAKEIDDYYTSNRNSPSTFFPIIKLKGDIFYAICRNPGCPNYNKRKPIYYHPQEERLPQCECIENMDLELDFPGQLKKEEETKRMLREVYRYLISSISCVIVCGVSGKWDKELVDFLRFCAIKRRLRIYLIGLDKPKAIVDALGSYFDDKNFIELDFSKDFDWPQGERKSDKINNFYIEEVPFLRDHFHASYKGGKGKDEILSEIHLTRNEDIINRFKQIKKEAVIRPVIGESKIHNSLEKASSYKNLESTYQLGLKNVLLDEREKTLHTRKAHSLGVRNIGLVWLKALSPYINSTVFNNLNWEKIIECLETALLLHDISHLPFSHMSEEIFGDLNWIILKEGAEHRHDEWQIEQLPNIEQEEIKKAIKESLKLSDQEFTSYYNFIQDLMAGVSGIPFLDAIMNSPLDADKIDYIYRDMEHAGRTTRLPKTIKDWLEPFLSHTSLTPEGLVRLNNEAAQCTLNLLRERQFLYESLYLLPEVRAFESIASTIIKTYLVLNVPQELSLNNFNPDLRSDKGKTAYELLMKEFNKLNKKDEFKLLFNICDELNKNGSGLTQSQAIDWFKKLEKLLNEIHSEHTKEGQKERSKLRREYEDILVNRPFYIPAQKTNEAKRIAREILMNYPCSIIIDIAKFPSFLPSSKARKYEYGGEINGEVFLAPNIDPSKWSKGGIAKIPLHKCDFSDFEKNYAQVILIDIEKKREKGKRIYWKFKELCKYNGIKIFESLEVM